MDNNDYMELFRIKRSEEEKEYFDKDIDVFVSNVNDQLREFLIENHEAVCQKLNMPIKAEIERWGEKYTKNYKTEFLEITIGYEIGKAGYERILSDEDKRVLLKIIKSNLYDSAKKQFNSSYSLKFGEVLLYLSLYGYDKKFEADIKSDMENAIRDEIQHIPNAYLYSLWKLYNLSKNPLYKEIFEESKKKVIAKEIERITGGSYYRLYEEKADAILMLCSYHKQIARFGAFKEEIDESQSPEQYLKEVMPTVLNLLNTYDKDIKKLCLSLFRALNKMEDEQLKEYLSAKLNDEVKSYGKILIRQMMK